MSLGKATLISGMSNKLWFITFLISHLGYNCRIAILSDSVRVFFALNHFIFLRKSWWQGQSIQNKMPIKWNIYIALYKFNWLTALCGYQNRKSIIFYSGTEWYSMDVDCYLKNELEISRFILFYFFEENFTSNRYVYALRQGLATNANGRKRKVKTYDQMNGTGNCVNLSPGKSMKNHTADLLRWGQKWERSVKMIYDRVELTVLYTSEIHRICGGMVR